ncbi:MAG: tyrosine-type recombinase/integrase [Terriglobales bacterium]
MSGPSENASVHAVDGRTIAPEANVGLPLKGELERMARRRFQDPTPVRRGEWWTIQVRQDVFIGEKRKRSNKRVRLAPATMPEREVQKIAAEYLRPLNQGLESIGSATNFTKYVNETYIPVVMPLLAKSTQNRSEGVISNYLIPAFGKLCLRDLTPLTIQRYFSEMSSSTLLHESRDKIRDVLASILKSAVEYGLLIKNPVESVRLPRPKGRRKSKPFVSPQQFLKLVEAIPEPYATMVFVAIYTGLRISELAGLRWNDIHADSITVDERYCRGDWGAPKSEASNATIGVNRCVIERIHRLKLLTVNVRAGRAVRKYRVVKSDGYDDLVFQSVQDGKPIRDNNILTRFLKPAGRELGMPWVNWRCLRTSHATWLKMAGADVKDAQAQMRHSRASTTLDIYQQFVPESQMRVVERLSTLVN